MPSASGSPPVPLATGLVALACLVATTGRAQRPAFEPAPAATLSEAERARRLAEAERYEQEAVTLLQAGKLDEAVEALGKKLALQREVLGGLHEDVVSSLGILARLDEMREDWAGARRALEEVLAIRQRQPDRKDWRIADARRALEDLGRRAAMPADRRLRLRRADELSRMVQDQRRRGMYEAAKAAALEELGIRREIQGEGHPDYATSLNNLAALYQAHGRLRPRRAALPPGAGDQEEGAGRGPPRLRRGA